MTGTTPLQQVVNQLQGAANILLVTHAKADGDGVSSILSLLLVLQKLDKKATAADSDPVAPMLQFLPEVDSVQTQIAGTEDLLISLPLGQSASADVSHRIEDGVLQITVRSSGQPFSTEEVGLGRGRADYDLIIACDTPELHMLGRLFEANPSLFYETPVVNIDHHPSNTGYGRVNLVDTTAASTTELITRVIQALETETNTKLMDADIATLLLTGLTTDTGSFQNANTTPRALEVAANLIDLGARQQEIIHHIYKTKQLSTLKLWGRVLSKIKSDPVYRIVWSTITHEDLTESAASEEEATGIIDELMTNAPGAEVVVLLKQNGDGIRGSLRTTTPAISATEIAATWGGGGHLQAAGFKIKGGQVEIDTPKVIEQIRAYQSARLGIRAEDEAKSVDPKITASADDWAEKIAAAAAKEPTESKKISAKKPGKKKN
jgi:phosphoesterase RecJ-like protein